MKLTVTKQGEVIFELETDKDGITTYYVDEDYDFEFEPHKGTRYN